MRGRGREGEGGGEGLGGRGPSSGTVDTLCRLDAQIQRGSFIGLLLRLLLQLLEPGVLSLLFTQLANATVQASTRKTRKKMRYTSAWRAFSARIPPPAGPLAEHKTAR